MDCQTEDIAFNEAKKFVENSSGHTVMRRKEVQRVEDFFVLNIYKNHRIRIHKPLITLKLALLLWFSASSSLMPFFNIFLQQRGFTLQDISIIYAISPMLQFVSTAVLGMVTDKFGRAKVILLLNLIISVILVLIMIVLPSVHEANCNFEYVVFECQKRKINTTHVESASYLNSNHNQSKLEQYVNGCSDLFTDSFCSENERLLLPQKNNFTILVNESSEITNFCYSDRIHCQSLLCHGNISCHIACKEWNNETCPSSIKSKSKALIFASIQTIYLMCYVNIFRFFDITAMALVKKHNSNYGMQRLFSTIGAITGPFLSTFIIHMTTIPGNEVNYENTLYLYSVLAIFTAIVVVKVDVHSGNTSVFAWKKLANFIKKPKVLLFTLVLLVLGTTWGFLINFLSIHLKSIKMEARMIGIVATMKQVYGLPILFTSSWLLKKIGAVNIFVLAAFSRAILCFGYAFLESTWAPLVLEITTAIGYHLFWVSVMHYCGVITPPGIVASVNSIAGSTHFTVGRVFGSLIGGMVMSSFGGSTAFVIMGGMNIACGVIYGIFLLTKYRD